MSKGFSLFVILVLTSVSTFAQTKKIAHRSHAGLMADFDLGDMDNLGLAEPRLDFTVVAPNVKPNDSLPMQDTIILWERESSNKDSLQQSCVHPDFQDPTVESDMKAEIAANISASQNDPEVAISAKANMPVAEQVLPSAPVIAKNTQFSYASAPIEQSTSNLGWLVAILVLVAASVFGLSMVRIRKTAEI